MNLDSDAVAAVPAVDDRPEAPAAAVAAAADATETTLATDTAGDVPRNDEHTTEGGRWHRRSERTYFRGGGPRNFP